MKQQIFSALRIYLFMSLLLGFIYPILVTGISQIFFPSQSNGNFIEHDGKVIGAHLIGQKFSRPEYFWPRPSANDYNPLSSGGSNAGPINKIFKKTVEERRDFLKNHHLASKAEEIPKDLIFASSSGLDPHISPQAAEYQIARVATARGLTENKLKSLLSQHIQRSQLGFLGEPTVNVLRLNLAIDQLTKNYRD